MNNNEFENTHSNDKAGAVTDNAQNGTDIQKGSQEDSQVLQGQDRADEAQEQTVRIEGDGFEEKASDNVSEEKGADAQDVTGDKYSTATAGAVNTPRTYSAGYVPPYHSQTYSPTYGGYGMQGGFAQQTKPQKKKYGSGVVVALGVLCAILAMCTMGMMALIMFGGDVGGFIDEPDETLQIQQGNKDIAIIENDSNNKDLTVVEIAALVGESVVEITTTHVTTNGYLGGQYITSGAGSGVFFSQTEKYGYIVTNYHVIDGANEITVRVKDGDRYKDYTAEYVGGDAAEDIAVVRIVPASDEKFTLAVFRDYKKSPLQVGEEVVAIGNPLGSLGGTVTNGILSALDRQIVIEDNVMTLLQTNAAINPGNSGGGLFDTAGNLIGVVNAKQSAEGIEGLGFAIPSNRVLEVIDDILNLGYVSGRPTLGIEVQYGTYGTSYWNRQEGLYVVDTGDTEFVKYDRIIGINGSEISSLAQYNAIVKSLTIGETATVTVVRDGAEKELTVTVKEDTAKG